MAFHRFLAFSFLGRSRRRVALTPAELLRIPNPLDAYSFIAAFSPFQVSPFSSSPSVRLDEARFRSHFAFNDPTTVLRDRPFSMSPAIFFFFNSLFLVYSLVHGQSGLVSKLLSPRLLDFLALELEPLHF